ncbi:MAG: hypothetical protein NVS9B11_23540 [Candidatus Dormibacteraceae bacterium]
MSPFRYRHRSVFEVLALGTSGAVGLAMAGVIVVQTRSDAGLLGVVGLSWGFLAVALLLLIGAARRGKVPGWSPTFYSLASTLFIAISLLALAFAWGGTSRPTTAGSVTTDVLILAAIGAVVTVALSFVPQARGVVK